jgi:hypothetical protein
VLNGLVMDGRRRHNIVAALGSAVQVDTLQIDMAIALGVVCNFLSFSAVASELRSTIIRQVLM